ncbi:MAG: hypothetical protein ACI9Z3_000946 [Roseivirga sp.]|jgi:hypothetical protein
MSDKFHAGLASLRSNRNANSSDLNEPVHKTNAIKMMMIKVLDAILFLIIVTVSVLIISEYINW